MAADTSLLALLQTIDCFSELDDSLRGILAQKTERPIKVLYGGLSAYWNLAETGKSVKAKSILPKAQETRPTVPAAPVQPVPKKVAPPKAKSAGC